MKKFIAKSFLLLLVFISFIVVPIVFVSNYDNIDRYSADNSNIITLQVKSQFDSLDLLFVGSSYSYAGICPELIDTIGVKSFNLGIATAGPEFYDLVINDYLNHINRPPKLIFILVSPLTFTNEADNYSAYPIHRYLETPMSNLDVAMKFGIYDKLIPMYKNSFIKAVYNIIRLNKRKSIDYNNAIKERGFQRDDREVTNEIILATKSIYENFRTGKFNFKGFEQLNQLTASLQAKGIKVIYFELPTYKLCDYLNPSFLLNYNKAVEFLKEKTPYYKLDDNLFSAKNYRNIDHLNYSGAVIATNEIIKYLINKKY